MIKRIIIFCMLILPTFLKADEGMWLLPQINALDIDSMHKLGFNLSAEDIYSITNPSLKDAVVIFGAGCTGEVVSPEGLIFTNHHCGYSAIQKLSTVDHDYLNYGFWAKAKTEELPCSGLNVTFLISFTNVTDSIIPFLPDSLQEEARKVKIKSLSDSIISHAKLDPMYKGEVRSFYGGNEFYLLVFEEFTDIRLVGTPPSSIGKFGGDTDNWMWPRHTGDFSIFRIYCSEDGTPAPYNPKNVPYKPKKFLNISIKGFKENDFSMILGNPGTTERYMTSSEIREIMNITNPIRIKIRGRKQDVMLDDMNKDPGIRIKYASKYARSSNYWKYSIGQNLRLKDMRIIERKKENELAFQNWVDSNDVNKNNFGNTLGQIERIINDRAQYFRAVQYYSEALYRGVDLVSFARKFVPIYEELKKINPDTSVINDAFQDINENFADFYRDYNIGTDIKISKVMLNTLSSDIDSASKFHILNTYEKLKEKAKDKFLAKIFTKTFFLDSINVREFIKNPELKKLNKDPAFVFAYSISKKYRDIYKNYAKSRVQLSKYQRLYVRGMLEMHKGQPHYPDANFSMRMTYGSIKGYQPKDGIHYSFYTTLKGVIEKEDSLKWEFTVPQKLKDLYETNNFGKYGKDGVMPVAFISNNDITGGNSGSPVLNGNGELIGIAFDGNWEAMSGDIIFEPTVQRTISVDIRYVLFILDKFGEAKYLLDELKIVN